MDQKPKKKRSAAEVLFYDDRAKWVEAMFANTPGHAEFKVLYFIAQRSSYEKGGSYWSVDRIAEECNCSTKTVSKATTEADRLGYLKVYREQGQKNFYRPIFLEGTRVVSTWVVTY